MLKHSETKNSGKLLPTLGLRRQRKRTGVSSHWKQWLWLKGHLSGANTHSKSQHIQKERERVNTSASFFSPFNVLLVSPAGQTQTEVREQGSSADAVSRDQFLGAQSRAEMEEDGPGQTVYSVCIQASICLCPSVCPSVCLFLWKQTKQKNKLISEA